MTKSFVVLHSGSVFEFESGARRGLDISPAAVLIAKAARDKHQHSTITDTLTDFMEEAGRPLTDFEVSLIIETSCARALARLGVQLNCVTVQPRDYMARGARGAHGARGGFTASLERTDGEVYLTIRDVRTPEQVNRYMVFCPRFRKLVMTQKSRAELAEICAEFEEAARAVNGLLTDLEAQLLAEEVAEKYGGEA